MKKILLSLLLIPSLVFSAGLPTVATSNLRLEPASLPTKCRLGDLRTDSLTNTIQFCDSLFSWNPVRYGTIPINQGGTGQISTITSPTANLYAGWDSNKNFQANSFISGFATTATAAGTTTLTVASKYIQQFTGATTQTIKLPDATTLAAAGEGFFIINSSSGILTVNDNSSALVTTIAAGLSAQITATAIGTSAGTWYVQATSSGGGVSPWVTSHAYLVGDMISYQQNTFICLTAHTSGTFATDIAAAKWVTTGASALVSPNLMQTGNSFEDNAVGGWVATGCATVTNGLCASVGSGGAVFSTSNGGQAKGANTTAAAVTSSSPIDGTYSLNLATSGAGTIGDGYISQSIPISTAYQAKVLTVKFKYKVASGTPVMGGTSANTYAADVYDVTNNSWLRLVGNFNFVQSTGVGDFVGTVQTASTTANIQLFVYSPVAPTGSSSLLLDNFYIGQQTAPMAPSIGDWVAYTPVFTNFGTATSISFFSRRSGDSLEVRGSFTPGSGAGSVGQITLGYNGTSGNVTADTAKLVSGVNLVGHGVYNASSATLFTTEVLIGSATPTVLNLGVQNSTTSGIAQSNGNAWGAQLEIFAKVPISGWSSNTVQSSDTDTRVVAARYALAGAVSLSTTQPVDYSTKIFDTSGSVTTGASWKFTAPVTGYYRVSTALAMGTSTCTLVVYKNGSLNAFLGSSTTTTYGGGSATVQLNAGDYIDVRSDAAAQNTNASTSQIISIERLSGPAVISATELIAARFYNSALNHSIGTSLTTLIGDTKSYDTHGALTASTGLFVAPVSGYYRISFNASSNTTGAVNDVISWGFIKNGSPVTGYGGILFQVPSAGVGAGMVGTDTILLNAGDTIGVQLKETVGAFTLNQLEMVTFERLKN